jgi:hypothetical protein
MSSPAILLSTFKEIETLGKATVSDTSSFELRVWTSGLVICGPSSARPSLSEGADGAYEDLAH